MLALKVQGVKFLNGIWCNVMYGGDRFRTILGEKKCGYHVGY